MSEHQFPSVLVLGSTGSVGRQTVEVAADLGAKAAVLTAARDVKNPRK